MPGVRSGLTHSLTPLTQRELLFDVRPRHLLSAALPETSKGRFRVRDKQELLTFCDFPDVHGTHLRTTNVNESSFAKYTATLPYPFTPSDRHRRACRRRFFATRPHATISPPGRSRRPWNQ